jgi:hypothetical protein
VPPKIQSLSQKLAYRDYLISSTILQVSKNFNRFFKFFNNSDFKITTDGHEQTRMDSPNDSYSSFVPLSLLFREPEAPPGGRMQGLK